MAGMPLPRPFYRKPTETLAQTQLRLLADSDPTEELEAWPQVGELQLLGELARSRLLSGRVLGSDAIVAGLPFLPLALHSALRLGSRALVAPVQRSIDLNRLGAAVFVCSCESD